jgi:hypothetical protein
VFAIRPGHTTLACWNLEYSAREGISLSRAHDIPYGHLRTRTSPP